MKRGFQLAERRGQVRPGAQHLGLRASEAGRLRLRGRQVTAQVLAVEHGLAVREAGSDQGVSRRRVCHAASVPAAPAATHYKTLSATFR